jgi:hypothetical protein
MQPCEHRGSQRRTGCCGGKRISMWICRHLKQEDGITAMNCVPKQTDNEAIKDASPSAMHPTWDKCVQVCEICPAYVVK